MTERERVIDVEAHEKLRAQMSEGLIERYRAGGWLGKPKAVSDDETMAEWRDDLSDLLTDIRDAALVAGVEARELVNWLLDEDELLRTTLSDTKRWIRHGPLA